MGWLPAPRHYICKATAALLLHAYCRMDTCAWMDTCACLHTYLRIPAPACSDIARPYWPLPRPCLTPMIIYLYRTVMGYLNWNHSFDICIGNVLFCSWKLLERRCFITKQAHYSWKLVLAHVSIYSLLAWGWLCLLMRAVLVIELPWFAVSPFADVRWILFKNVWRVYQMLVKVLC